MCNEITQDELMATRMIVRCRVRTLEGWGGYRDYTVTVAQAQAMVRDERDRFARLLGVERPAYGALFLATQAGDEVIVAGIGIPLQLAYAGLTERA